MREINTRFVIVILFLSSLGWGLTWMPIKWMNDAGLNALLLVLIAFSSAGVMLTPLLFIQRKFWRQKKKYLLLVALFGGLANVSFQTAIYHGDVIRVMILFYLLPVWSVIGGKLFFHERIDLFRTVAVIAALSGAFLILGVDKNFLDDFSYLDLLAICSGLGLALNNLVFRATPDIPSASKISVMFLGCASMMGGYLLAGDVSLSLPDETALTGYAVLYGIGWITLITFGTQWSVTHLEAGRSSLIIVTELLVAVISAAIITETAMTMVEVLGGLLVLSAAVIEASRASGTHEFSVKELGN